MEVSLLRLKTAHSTINSVRPALPKYSQQYNLSSDILKFLPLLILFSTFLFSTLFVCFYLSLSLNISTPVMVDRKYNTTAHIL